MAFRNPEQSPRGPLPTRPAPTCVEQPEAEQQQQQQRWGRRRPEPGAAVLLSPGGGGGGGAGRCCSHAHARPCRSRALRRGRRRGRSGWAGPLAAAWAGGRASLPPLLPFRPASETSRRRRRNEQGVAGGGRWQQGAETSRRPDAAGRERERGGRKRYKDRERAPRAAPGAPAAGPRRSVGSTRVEPGEPHQPWQAAARRAPHPWPARSINLSPALSPRPRRIPTNRGRPRPRPHSSPLPIGCKRASRPRTSLLRLTQVPRPPPAGGAASLGPRLLPASLCFFFSSPTPFRDHGFLVPNRNGRQRLSLGPRSRRTGL